MAAYACLNKQVFFHNEFSIVPIRMEDRHLIMKWRNEQLYHLRQNKPLTSADQDAYFANVVTPLFAQEQPNQILFSYLHNGTCIGYGALVHINWVDKHAEISFVMNTALEKDAFVFHWCTYLAMIEEVAFNELPLHKIFTYAFDLRPQLYVAMEQSGFIREAELKEHCFFGGEYRSVVYHSKINGKEWKVRKSLAEDISLLFGWANDEQVRSNALHTEKISWENHVAWYHGKLQDENCEIWIFSHSGQDVGQVRVEWKAGSGLIDYSVDPSFRGKGYGTRMINWVKQHIHGRSLIGKVRPSNIASIKVFEKCAFVLEGETEENGTPILTYKFSGK